VQRGLWESWTFEEPNLAWILDPIERDSFKTKRVGVREFIGGTVGIALEDKRESGAQAQAQIRTTSRSFPPKAIPYRAFCRWLGALAKRRPQTNGHYRYASAGGSYSVQTYVYAHGAQDRGVERVPEGAYYYNPEEHALYPIDSGARLSRTAHATTNRAAFDEASLSVFLICALEAVTPLYGGEGIRMACIEAGMMSQLLDEAALQENVGICHIGAVDAAQCARVFDLERNHLLLHSLVAGAK